ncbi:MAG: Hsp70 family protein, partial [Spirochaetes bacterium]|nr:Hsp70 family protein [Spirochaetota bacterium]
GGVMVTMIPRNMVLPTRASAIFTTVKDYQKAVTIHIFQGERTGVADNISLGSFRLEGIGRAPKGEPRIRVTFEIDTSGIVQVTAEDLDTGRKYSVKLNHTFELSDEDVSAVITEARASEMEDLRYMSKRRDRY